MQYDILFANICSKCAGISCLDWKQISGSDAGKTQYIPITFINRGIHLAFNTFKILIAKIFISLFM